MLAGSTPGPKPTLLLAIALAVGLTVVAAPVAADHGGGAFSHCSNPSVTIHLVNLASPFVPTAAAVQDGTCVEFVNDGVVTHNVRVLEDTQGHNKAPIDPVLKTGESTTVLYDAQGRYHMQCKFHPTTMHGFVQVT